MRKLFMLLFTGAIVLTGTNIAGAAEADSGNTYPAIVLDGEAFCRNSHPEIVSDDDPIACLRANAPDTLKAYGITVNDDTRATTATAVTNAPTTTTSTEHLVSAPTIEQEPQVVYHGPEVSCNDNKSVCVSAISAETIPVNAVVPATAPTTAPTTTIAEEDCDIDMSDTWQDWNWKTISFRIPAGCNMELEITSNVMVVDKDKDLAAFYATLKDQPLVARAYGVYGPGEHTVSLTVIPGIVSGEFGCQLDVNVIKDGQSTTRTAKFVDTCGELPPAPKPASCSNLTADRSTVAINDTVNFVASGTNVVGYRFNLNGTPVQEGQNANYSFVVTAGTYTVDTYVLGEDNNWVTSQTCQVSFTVIPPTIKPVCAPGHPMWNTSTQSCNPLPFTGASIYGVELSTIVLWTTAAIIALFFVSTTMGHAIIRWFLAEQPIVNRRQY